MKVDAETRKWALIACAFVLLGLLIHFGGYVARGRNSDTSPTRYGTWMQTKDVSPYYDAILHFFGDPDIK